MSHSQVSLALNGRDDEDRDLGLDDRDLAIEGRTSRVGTHDLSSSAIATPGMSAIAGGLRFTYYPLARIHNLSPLLALASGGTLLTIRAAGLDSFGDVTTTKCRFDQSGAHDERVSGGVHDDAQHGAQHDAQHGTQHGTQRWAPHRIVTVAALRKNRGEVVCEVPAEEQPRAHDARDNSFDTFRAPATAAVSLTLNDHDYQPVGVVAYFSFAIHGVHPAGGPVAGGTLLTIRGTGFDSARAGPGSDVSAASATSSQQPISALGSAITDLLRDARCRIQYWPKDGPAVAADAREVKPDAAPDAALAGVGAARYLNGGSDRLGATWPRAWQADTPLLSHAARELRCATPAAPTGFVGRVFIFVTLNGQDYLPLTATAHTLTSADFVAADDEDDGTTAAAAASQCVHHGALGCVSFDYYLTTFHGVSPRGGPARGGTAVVIRGSGLASFGTLNTTLCRFGALTVRASTREGASLTCTAPDTCEPLGSTSSLCRLDQPLNPLPIRGGPSRGIPGDIVGDGVDGGDGVGADDDGTETGESTIIGGAAWRSAKRTRVVVGGKTVHLSGPVDLAAEYRGRASLSAELALDGIPVDSALEAGASAAADVPVVPLAISLNGQDFTRVVLGETPEVAPDSAPDVARVEGHASDGRVLDFAYFALPVLTNLNPDGGPVTAAHHGASVTTVTVIGSGFDALAQVIWGGRGAAPGLLNGEGGAWCKIGHGKAALATPARVLNSTAMVCQLPARAGAGVHPVRVPPP